MFRRLYSAHPHNARSLFGVPQALWEGYSDSAMHLAEANIQALLDGEDPAGSGAGVKDTARLT